jgi:hypothetical protein
MLITPYGELENAYIAKLHSVIRQSVRATNATEFSITRGNSDPEEAWLPLSVRTMACGDDGNLISKRLTNYALVSLLLLSAASLAGQGIICLPSPAEIK